MHGRVQGVEFLDRRSKPFASDDPAALEAQRQLQRYFRDNAVGFSLPLQLLGTDFQKRVWHALTRISRGRVRTYGEIASELNTSPRAVGNACRANPVPLLVPCHRVISASGIGGFAGATRGRHLEIKRWLLQHEGVCL
ncbi:MAG: methylated-DNA--[protein]-cysteine S-methyltransferase [Gammaproteobacteria bacterium]|nr:methylated-DNA--[protein]-cysteine S-methyltransferase [Gammaproteobacteria bacterium]